MVAKSLFLTSIIACLGNLTCVLETCAQDVGDNADNGAMSAIGLISHEVVPDEWFTDRPFLPLGDARGLTLTWLSNGTASASSALRPRSEESWTIDRISRQMVRGSAYSPTGKSSIFSSTYFGLADASDRYLENNAIQVRFGLRYESDRFFSDPRQFATSLQRLDAIRWRTLEGAVTMGSFFGKGNVGLAMDGNLHQASSGCDIAALLLQCGDARSYGYRLSGQVGFGDASLSATYYGGDELQQGIDWWMSGADREQATIDDMRPGRLSIQGSFAFNDAKTRIGIGYSQSSLSRGESRSGLVDISGSTSARDLDMWTVGVYHDVNTWFQLVAEYSHTQQAAKVGDATAVTSSPSASNALRVGGFIFW